MGAKPDRSDFLVRLFHHRWCAPAAGEIARLEGCRFAVLQNRLEVSPVSLRSALESAMELGLIRRNPGYGHPLRPEYLPTPSGRRAAPLLDELQAGLAALGAGDLALLKWSLPVLDAVSSGKSRFSELEAALSGITPRALAAALRGLADHRLVLREIEGGFPPVPRYTASRTGKRIARILLRMAEAL